MASIGTAQPAPTRSFSLNDPVIRGIFYQVVVAILVVLFLVWIVNNTAANLQAQNKTSGFDFLGKTAGFDISFSLLPWSRTSYYWEAFLVGLTNTILVAAIGIFFATILGFILGIARLSSNFIISRIATVYIETIRNIPLLLQLFFWYFAVLKAMPAVRNSLALPFDVFINQRGLFVPKPLPDEQFGYVVIAFLVGIALSVVLRAWAKRRLEATGKRFPTFWASVLADLRALGDRRDRHGRAAWRSIRRCCSASTSPAASNCRPSSWRWSSASPSTPRPSSRETVRGGIMAVSHGQTEPPDADPPV